jgi:hypothetical protein
MQNGQNPPQQTNINPAQAAIFALQFLEQVAHTRAQREAFDIAVSLLQALASGQVIVAPAPQREQTPVQLGVANPVAGPPDAQ